MKRFIMVIVGFAALLGGAQAEVDEETRSAAVAVFDEMRETFERHAGQADPSPLFALLRPDTAMVSPGGPVWDRIYADAAEQGLPFPNGFSIDVQPREVVVMSEEWAYEFGTSVVTYTPQGEEPMTVRDTYLLLLRNEGEGWKLYREVASLRAPPGGW
ncbi:nuclear transport factor 2 family protein [Parvularcula maris]|uniref:Nuclear transport factor 2 family protein n=1 Tax=Parvularcula maris TaxID=2965077 RepID=A0A9X2L8E0_9PROT|nr:nuclear transport factor 2 family protein [Parvularcula maris]MCQ8184985.1 nuclear transport factor 2 family protein [Parvularcula maris]